MAIEISSMPPVQPSQPSSGKSEATTTANTPASNAIPASTKVEIQSALKEAGILPGNSYTAKVVSEETQQSSAKIVTGDKAIPAPVQLVLKQLLGSSSTTAEGKVESPLLTAVQIQVNGKVLAATLNTTAQLGNLAPNTLLRIQLQPDLSLLAQPLKSPIQAPNQANTQNQKITQALGKVLAQQAPLSEGMDQLFKQINNTALPQPARRILILIQQLLPAAPPPSAQGKAAATSTQTTATLQVAPKLAPSIQIKSAQTQTIQTQSPAPAAMSPQQIQGVLQRSGHFLEANLSKIAQQQLTETSQGQSKTPAQFPADIKALLLKVLSMTEKSMRNTPVTAPQTSAATSTSVTPVTTLADPFTLTPFKFPSLLSSGGSTKAKTDEPMSTGQILKLLAGMINRIQLHQLNSLFQSQQASPDQPVQQTWLMEIPFANQQSINPFQVRIDYEKNSESEQSNKKKQNKWQLTLAFDLERLGPMFIQVTLLPDSVSSTVWAKEPKTLQLLDKERGHYRQQLEKLGIKVEDILFRKGEPELPQVKLEKRMVDINA